MLKTFNTLFRTFVRLSYYEMRFDQSLNNAQLILCFIFKIKSNLSVFTF